MNSYAKLFSSIITSTIWTEDDRTRIVWITMLACADRNGEIQASIPGLARIAGVPVEDCRAAITKFLSPDPDSRTKDDEGRRIEEIEGGWLLLNYGKYRDMATDEDRKRQAAERQQKHRERVARNLAATIPAVSRDSNGHVTPESRQISHTEAEAEAKAEKDTEGALPLEVEKKSKPFRPPLKIEVETYFVELGMKGNAPKEAEKFLNYHDARGWLVGKVKAKDWRAMARTWKGNAEDFAARDAAPAPGTGKPENTDYLKEWPVWLKAHGHKAVEYQFAPDFLKSDFWKERKAKAAK